MTIRNWGRIGGAALLVLVSADVWAQPPRTGLEANVDVFGGWDVDLGSSLPDSSTGEPVTNQDVQYGGINGSLFFSNSGRRVSFEASGNASMRAYTGAFSDVVPAYGGFVQVGSAAGARRRWSVSQNLSFSPLNALNFYPGAPVPSSPVDYRIADGQQVVSDTSAVLGYRLSRAGELSFFGNYNAVEGTSPSSDSDVNSFRRWSVGGRYTHAVSRYSNLYGGYTYSQSRTLSAPDAVDLQLVPKVHSIDAGMSYRRPLSFSRRTSIFAQAGSTATEGGEGGAQYDFVGTAGIDRQIGRTWGLRGVYDRSVRFVPAFADPLLTSGFTGSAAGRLSQRTALSFVANLSNGTVGVSSGDNAIASYSASAQFRWAFARRVGFYGEYFFFQSEFGDAVPLPNALAPYFRRNGVRVGLSFGTTLLGERR